MSPQFPISPEDWARTPPVVRALVIKLWREMRSAQKAPAPPSEEDLDGQTPPSFLDEPEMDTGVSRADFHRPPPDRRKAFWSGQADPTAAPAPEALKGGEQTGMGRDGEAAKLKALARGEQSDPPRVPAEATKMPVDEQAVEALYQRAYGFVEEVVLAARAGQPFTVEVAFAIVARIVGLEGAMDLFYKRAIYARESSGEGPGFYEAVITHSVNVGIYVLRVGEGLGLSSHRLIDLGVAALLHDVGMARLPDSIIEKKGKLTDAEMAELRRHPQYGYDILSQLGSDTLWLAEVALQEQEREDGSGYPKGLKGDQIHEYARIIAVADCFAGLTRSRPDRRGMMPFEAVRFILQNQRSLLNPRILRVLLTRLTAFPLHTEVRLNSGVVARVVETHEAQPLRPCVEILCDAQGNRLDPPRIIDLREMPILHITEVI